MSKIVKWLGSIVFAASMYSVPILAVWSIWHGWPHPIQLLFVFFSIGQFAGLVLCVYFKVKEGE